jgi:hypothetical protein
VAARCDNGDKVTLGFLHYNGTEEAQAQLGNLAKFFAGVAGEQKGQVIVNVEQNQTGLLTTLGWSGLGGNTNAVFEQVKNIFAQEGIDVVTRDLVGGSSVYYRFDLDSERGRIKREPGSMISAELPQYFTSGSSRESEEDGKLKPEIRETREKFWDEFNKAESVEAQQGVVEKYSPEFLLERLIVEGKVVVLKETAKVPAKKWDSYVDRINAEPVSQIEKE